MRPDSRYGWEGEPTAYAWEMRLLLDGRSNVFGSDRNQVSRRRCVRSHTAPHTSSVTPDTKHTEWCTNGCNRQAIPGSESKMYSGTLRPRGENDAVRLEAVYESGQALQYTGRLQVREAPCRPRSWANSSLF